VFNEVNMSDTTQLNQRNFATIQAELERITADLKTIHDPERRRELLRQMRVLIQEATQVANSL
jgi:hypothetical protein